MTIEVVYECELTEELSSDTVWAKLYPCPCRSCTMWRVENAITVESGYGYMHVRHLWDLHDETPGKVDYEEYTTEVEVEFELDEEELEWD